MDLRPAVVTVSRGAEQMKTAEIAAMLRGERRHVPGDFLHHPRVGLSAVTFFAAEMLGQRHHAQWKSTSHALMRGVAPDSAGIAFDPHQFAGSAADIEQDRAMAMRIEQRRAADDGERRLGLAVDHLGG